MTRDEIAKKVAEELEQALRDVANRLGGPTCNYASKEFQETERAKMRDKVVKAIRIALTFTDKQQP